MASVKQLFQDLLGLPVTDAVARAQAAGVEPVVCQSSAPRRDASAGGTLRVIRVQQDEAGLRLTVSAFMDGDPRK